MVVSKRKAGVKSPAGGRLSKADIAKMAFPHWCEQSGLGRPVEEFVFHDVRKFRFDFCWPELMIAIECEGGVFPNKEGKSAHRSISGMLRDIQKYNLAAADGWLVLRQVPDKLCTAEMMDLIRKAHTLREPYGLSIMEEELASS